jgi:hypothetical protein
MPRGSNYQKPYPPELRREAVALYRRAGRPMAEIARDLGVLREEREVLRKAATVFAKESETR